MVAVQVATIITKSARTQASEAGLADFVLAFDITASHQAGKATNLQFPKRTVGWSL